MKRLEAMLPTSESGAPDFEYMIDYIRDKRLSMLNRYRKYIIQQIIFLGDYIDTIPLKDKKWTPFILDDIFTIGSGTRLESRNKQPGNKPFIGELITTMALQASFQTIMLQMTVMFWVL